MTAKKDRLEFWVVVVFWASTSVPMFGLAWAAWHYRGISAGEITGKAFYPAHSETRYHHVCIDYENSRYIDIPYEVWIPDRWTILIRGKNGSGVEVNSRINVTESEYSRVKIGESWGYEENPR